MAEMRFKIEIQEEYQTGQDRYGEPFYQWRAVCSCWASFAAGGLLVKYSDKIKPDMRAIGAGRIMTIGKTVETTDGGTKFLKLSISSVRGDYARTRDVPKAAALPGTHNKASTSKGEEP